MQQRQEQNGSYYRQVSQCIQQRKGKQLASLLSVKDAGTVLFTQSNQHVLTEPWRSLVTRHLTSRVKYEAKDFKAAFAASLESCDKALSEIISSIDTDTNWWHPIVAPLATHLRLCSYECDEVSAAVNVLRRLMQLGIQDRNEPQYNKKQYCLAVVVQLFKAFFRLNDYGACKPLQRTLDSAGLPPLSSFPISQVVAYKFYQGRLHMAASNYDEAKEALQFAFDNCPSSALRNKRRILTILIPLKLLWRISPKPELLQKYKLWNFYGDLVNSVCTGNLGLFNLALNQNQSFYIRKGIFLIVEKLRQICYLSIIKKVQQFQSTEQSAQNEPNHLLPMSTLRAACRVYGADISNDELECELVNLITADPPRIRGYIAHARYLVLAKNNPFPSL